MTTTTTSPPVDLEAVKAKQQINWSAGNYAVIGTTLQLLGEAICEAVDISAGSRVIDIAAGNGNASLAAARRSCEVVALDYVPSLLAQLDERAAAERLVITTEVGDAEAIAHPDASFDVALSTVGIMFAPDHQRAADELVRVLKPGGKFGLLNWTPAGFVGQMFKIIGSYVPPPAGVKSPMLWGTGDHLETLFAGNVSSLKVTPMHFVFRYRSAEEMVEAFKTFYGPIVKAFEALDPEGATGLRNDLINLCNSLNTSADGTLCVPAEYVEVVGVRS